MNRYQNPSGASALYLNPAPDVACAQPAAPVTADLAHRLQGLASDASGIKERLASLFGEGEALAKEAHPVAAGAFGTIQAALADLEMFMRRIDHYVSRI